MSALNFNASDLSASFVIGFTKLKLTERQGHTDTQPTNEHREEPKQFLEEKKKHTKVFLQMKETARHIDICHMCCKNKNEEHHDQSHDSWNPDIERC